MVRASQETTKYFGAWSITIRVPDSSWDGAKHASCVPFQPHGKKVAEGEGDGKQAPAKNGHGKGRDEDEDEDETLWWDVLQGQPSLVDDAALKGALAAELLNSKFAVYNRENEESSWRKSVLIMMTSKVQILAEDETFVGMVTVAEILGGWGQCWKLPSADERSAAAARPCHAGIGRLQPPGVRLLRAS